MEELGKSRWEGNEHWFKFGHQAELKRFDEISTLGSTGNSCCAQVCEISA